MRATAEAFGYLIWTGWRNRLIALVKRLRTPRYAGALIVGALYIYLFLLRPSRSGVGPLLLGRPAEAVVTLLMVLTLMGAWVFGSDLLALSFSPAEVSLLFPAPLTRRALIGYKLVRAQIAVLINVLIWVLILRRGGRLLPVPLRALGLWVMFSTLNLHRIGAALVRASWGEHRRAGLRQHWMSALVFGSVAVAFAAGLYAARAQIVASQSVGSFLTAVAGVVTVPPASIGLYLFHLIIAPTYARSASEWVNQIGPAVLVLLAHVWWVLRTDTAFEEAAVEASAERARRIEAMRARRAGAGVALPRSGARVWTLRLAPTGLPAAGIVWKNTLCFFRTLQLRVFVSPIVVGIGIGLAAGGGRRDPAQLVWSAALTLVAVLVVFGGRLIRNDLRHDMLHLPMLKTLPLRGREIVAAEILSATLPMVVVQGFLLLVAYVAMALAATEPPVPAALRFALLVTAPLSLLALNVTLMTVQNGAAVLFPAWIRLGPLVAGGVEALGQNVMTLVGTLLLTAIALIAPVALGAGVYFWAGLPRALSLGIGVTAASVVLGAEVYGVVMLLGRAFEKAEPIQA